ncbi:mycofactocin biosynthesis chaperone MftB [Flexivirga caeni]|uniref:Mycofactocin biosynthesis chaperone MftB n=1 Tax=Flexivirga caeni TaxID=2294115 RepID=A0A3M9M2Q3_9MICO|nr:mycofactocin biosynthesis chaperone MftB [Flexivirga caeni]RNI19844.1 mycofactocin biosynthesis chaperone MftB [Flexivirga caeni]
MLDEAWVLNGSVALRPEPFGALAYDFTTRRLSFLKDPALVEVVRALGEHATVTETFDAVGIAPADRPRFGAALERLAGQQMIVRRDAA